MFHARTPEMTLPVLEHAQELLNLIATGKTFDVTVGAAIRFRVTATADEGFHSGRRRFHVRCAACRPPDSDVHDATTGPVQLIYSHMRSVHSDVSIPKFGITSLGVAERLQQHGSQRSQVRQALDQPVCCGHPMRKAAFHGWICNGGAEPEEGKGCERHESPDGIRTAGPWWREPLGFARRVRLRVEGHAEQSERLRSPSFDARSADNQSALGNLLKLARRVAPAAPSDPPPPTGAHWCSFLLLGNLDAVYRHVRRMLDNEGFGDVALEMKAATAADLEQRYAQIIGGDARGEKGRAP